jgi:hypothetical protein
MIVSKAIYNINAVTLTDLDGNNVLNFSYEVKDNYDNDEGTFDSHYQYSYNIPIKDLSIKLINNLDDEYTEYFEMKYGNNQISFGSQEYYLIDNSQPLDPGAIYTLVNSIIYS